MMRSHLLNPFSVPSCDNYYYCRSFSYTSNYCYYRYSSNSSNTTSWSFFFFDRWHWRTSAKRSRFSDAYLDEEDDVFGFENASTKRTWWSDDSYEDEDDDDDEDEGFGFFQGSIGINWILKVFQAFGWMIPAVIISLLFGTGPNTLIPALALPLAQSAFSLVADALWGRSAETPRPKSKSKKRPFARATSNYTRARRRKGNGSQPRKESGDYKSWLATNNVSAKNGTRSSRNFGGWDELDNQVKEGEEPDAMPVKNANEQRAEESVKVSRRMKGDTPLLLRLLFATFPFLGFWTKLL